jgi:hypothetical protein
MHLVVMYKDTAQFDSTPLEEEPYWAVCDSEDWGENAESSATY